jgi:hypothetical protein
MEHMSRPAVIWGAVWGAIQAASPLAFWWLDASTVYALGLALIATIYIGFAVADGRAPVIAVKTSVAALFVVAAAAATSLRTLCVETVIDRLELGAWCRVDGISH